MRSWIHHAKGRFVRQARVGLGDLREELIGRQGFFGPVATVYREHGPNEIVRVEGTLYPRRAADTGRVEASDGRDARGSPEVLLSNADVSVAVSRRSAAMPFAYRNVDGDLLYFVHKGSGQFVTEFGRLVYEPGDYVLIPKGITFSVWPDAGDSHMLVVESGGAVVADGASAGGASHAGRSHGAGVAGAARSGMASARGVGAAGQAWWRVQFYILQEQSAGVGWVEGRFVSF